MTHDPIVAEVRAIREQIAAKFDFDIRRMIADAQQRQFASGARVVSPPARATPVPHGVSLSEERGRE